MARKAFVTSDMAHDERLFDVAENHPTAALMWPWMLTYLDDWGRGLASPRRIKSQLFPNIDTITATHVAEAIDAYAEAGLIERYSDGEHEYMAIPSDKWFKWQTHIRKEKRTADNSKFPPCPSDCAQMRDGFNEQRENARTLLKSGDRSDEIDVCTEKRIPSPTPSLSLTPTKDDNNDTQVSESNTDSPEKEQSLSSYDADLAQIGRIYQEEGFGSTTPLVAEKLIAILADFERDWVFQAFRESVRQGVKKLSYVERMLENWRKEGRVTIGERSQPLTVYQGSNRDGPSTRVSNQLPAEVEVFRKYVGGT